MARRRAVKLLAVALLAGAPAYADNTTQATQTAATQRTYWRTHLNSRTVDAITPRMLANGYERPLTAAEQSLLAAKVAYDKEFMTPIVLPRLLANARPACGNTGGKDPRPADCTAAETKTAKAANTFYDKAGRERQRRIDVAYEKLIDATAAAAAADLTLHVRLLESGRPACGNTLSKSASKCKPKVEL
jgi:hypothetical protein